MRRYGYIDNKNIGINGIKDKEDKSDVKDAILRHNRRHPDAKLESGIFSECNFIEFAY